jgi:plasmid stability protein
MDSIKEAEARAVLTAMTSDQRAISRLCYAAELLVFRMLEEENIPGVVRGKCFRNWLPIR